MPGSTSQTQCSLTVMNHSNSPKTIILFQKDSDLPDALSLVWLAHYLINEPNTRLTFSWIIDYEFVLGKIVGSVFEPSETVPAGLQENNQISLDYEEEEYRFIKRVTEAPFGELRILESANIPARVEAFVGIGMSGLSTLIVPARPNMDVRFANSPPKYYIVAGDFSKGEVLSPEIIANSAEVKFPEGVSAMTAILNPDGSWTIKTTS